MTESSTGGKTDLKRAGRIKKLQQDISDLCDGEATFKASASFPDDSHEAYLQDILAFESVATGISMFEGLQKHGIDLPHPDKLNEFLSQRKAMEILRALADLRVFLVGFDKMGYREFYSTLWHQTLWEGCYVKKRHPDSVTVIDVSHKMNRSEIEKCLNTLMAKGTRH